MVYFRFILFNYYYLIVIFNTGITEVRNVKRARKAYSSKAEILCKLADRHEMPTIIMEWRKLRHLSSHYVDILALHSFYDSRYGMHRIYSTISQTSAPTGRLAMNCITHFRFFIYF